MLCWLHIPHCWKSHVAAQRFMSKSMEQEMKVNVIGSLCVLKEYIEDNCYAGFESSLI